MALVRWFLWMYQVWCFIEIIIYKCHQGFESLASHQELWKQFRSSFFRRSDKMETYIYPENLRANVKLWFWNVRDFIIICTGLILSVVVLVNLWNILPIAATASYAFLSLRADETSIIDYIFNAVKFFLTSQQLYLWRKD